VVRRTDTTFAHARGIAALVAVCACFAFGAEAAMAQSGGTAPPGSTAPPPTTPTTPTTGSFVFPVQGAHNYGGPSSRYGAGRTGHTHQGQDVFAPCGTTLVSPINTKVLTTGFQSSAGNYVVLRYKRMRHDYMYAHLATTVVTKKMKLAPGQPVGTVGETGNASGCHLHFELWKRPGWYRGGRPIDPYPTLLAWDPSF
jgi:murein DD-endopeptidase MepM/ murein hydrolase activator NlpD